VNKDLHINPQSTGWARKNNSQKYCLHSLHKTFNAFEIMPNLQQRMNFTQLFTQTNSENNSNGN